MLRFFLEITPTFSWKEHGLRHRSPLRHDWSQVKAAKSFDIATMNWKEGAPYSWDEYYQWQEEGSIVDGDVCFEPPASYFVNRIIAMNFVYILFWLYLDHVIASNRGVAYSFYFPFQKTYWKRVFKGFLKSDEKKDTPE